MDKLPFDEQPVDEKPVDEKPAVEQLEQQIAEQVADLAGQLIGQGWLLASAESCTGGLLAKSCTDLAGSSAWFDRAFITYSNAAKQDMLGVDPQLIGQQGAVSEAVALAMVDGVLAQSDATLACAITGIAGPGGATSGKPVGTVWFGFARRASHTAAGQRFAQHQLFTGDRAQVRGQATLYALRTLSKLAVEAGC